MQSQPNCQLLQKKQLFQSSTTSVGGKYPPAKPGALECEPLEAVGGVADAAP